MGSVVNTTIIVENRDTVITRVSHSSLIMEDSDNKVEQSTLPQLDEQTVAILKEIHKDMDYEDPIVDEDINWEDFKQNHADPVELMIEKVYSFKDKIFKKFKKSKEVVQDLLPDVSVSKSRCELTRELEDAWNLYSRGLDQIPSRSVGYILRILGQNPTEDDIVEMVMKANCDWDGLMSRNDFIEVAIELLRDSCNGMDDVRAAFRVFDHNNDGTISKEELMEAMLNFGTRVTEDEFQTMFEEADRNNDGLIDFDEFVEMMMPSTVSAGGSMAQGGNKSGAGTLRQ